MPGERLSMRQIREVLRLRFASELPQRAIAKSLGLSQGAVSGYLSRARAASLVWPLPEDLDDAQLEALLFPLPPAIAADQRPLPDWAWVHRELRRPDVTLALLWEEYRADAPDAYRRREAVRRFRRPHRRGRRWPHRRDHPGADLCRRPGRIELHLRRGGVEPEAAGLDRRACPRLCVFRRCRPADGQRQSQGRHHQGLLLRADGQSDPSLRWGRLYADLARHYGTAIVPARPYKPRDKAKVEVGVQVVGRWILARLRHRRFFSLAELNAAIHALLYDLNNRLMRGWGVSRRTLYEQLDQPALVALPSSPYEYAEWKRCRVGLDYHVEIAKHYYSVPHQLLRQEVEARITVATIEIFHRGKRVASHQRSLLPH